MVLQIVAIFDKKLEAYGVPIFVTAVGAAMRMFGDDANNVGGESGVGKHPEDYSLWHFGSYEDVRPKFEFFPDGPKRLCEAADLLIKPVR